MTLQDKTILITGASRGIGEATAILAGQQGARVVINYVSDEDQAEQTAQKVLAAGGETMMVQADVSDFSQAEHMMQHVQEEFGSIDVLVNNAGVLSTKPLDEEDPAFLDQLIMINLGGPVHTCAAVLPIMTEQASGTIINVSSQAAKQTFPGMNLAAYSASKAGVLRLTQVLAQEVKADGITVYAVLPGGTATDMTGNQGMPPEKVGQRILDIATGSVILESGAHSEIYQ